MLQAGKGAFPVFPLRQSRQKEGLCLIVMNSLWWGGVGRGGHHSHMWQRTQLSVFQRRTDAERPMCCRQTNCDKRTRSERKHVFFYNKNRLYEVSDVVSLSHSSTGGSNELCSLLACVSMRVFTQDTHQAAPPCRPVWWLREWVRHRRLLLRLSFQLTLYSWRNDYEQRLEWSSFSLFFYYKLVR